MGLTSLDSFNRPDNWMNNFRLDSPTFSHNITAKESYFAYEGKSA